MTPDKLREMVAAATPGPWEYRQWGIDGDEWPDSRVSVGRATQNGEAVTISPRYGEREQDISNAALIALAPELAEVAAEQHEALSWCLSSLQTVLEGRPHKAIPEMRACADAALARFATLGETATTEGEER